jgi:glycosyltransferase involved in cell wall biosynthesis
LRWRGAGKRWGGEGRGLYEKGRPVFQTELQVADMRTKLVIVTEIIAPYRIPVFNALAKRPDVDLHITFLAETDAALRQWPIYRSEISFSHQVLPSWRWRAGSRNLLLNRGLGAALRQAAPGVIICGGYNYPASWQALHWARRNRVEFVLWSESNGRDARAGNAWVERTKAFFLRRCDRFAVPGRAARQYLRELGCEEARILDAPNAVDNRLFASQAESVRRDAAGFRERMKLPRRFILFVGRLVPEKGIFDLLEAYARLEMPLRAEIGLVYAGDGRSRHELMRQAEQIAPGAVVFPGFAEREKLSALYALAEALVLPTHSDTWGLVVNEAMACGLPVIVSDVAGCSMDLVEHGWNGYVVPARDAEKLAVAMDRLLRDSEQRQRMSEHSLERIQAYSPEACAEGLAATLPGSVGAA